MGQKTHQKSKHYITFIVVMTTLLIIVTEVLFSIILLLVSRLSIIAAWFSISRVVSSFIILSNLLCHLVTTALPLIPLLWYMEKVQENKKPVLLPTEKKWWMSMVLLKRLFLQVHHNPVLSTLEASNKHNDDKFCTADKS